MEMRRSGLKYRWRHGNLGRLFLDRDSLVYSVRSLGGDLTVLRMKVFLLVVKCCDDWPDREPLAGGGLTLEQTVRGQRRA